MRRRAFAILMALLTLLGLPGASEAAENLAHGAVSGHAAHSVAAADGGHEAHHPVDVEHGCGGGVHVCPCHAPLVAAPTGQLALASPVREAGLITVTPVVRPILRGVRPGIDRPPTV